MMKKTLIAAGIALATGITATTASAHGGVQFPPYVIFIGFNSEPAFAGEPNTLDFYAYWDKQGDGSCDTDTDCIGIDTSKKGGKVEFLPGGYVKLLYCGPLEDDHGHGEAAAAEDDHEHGACDHPLAETVIADEHHPLDQSYEDTALYHSEYFKPMVPGVYGFKIDGLKLKKQGNHPSVVLNDQLFVCTANHFSCISALKEFPGPIVHPH